MAASPRGADLVVDALVGAGVQHLFTLSGNQILSVYDATVGRGLLDRSAVPSPWRVRPSWPGSRVVSLVGDGTFGFHAFELDTAVRHRLPVLTVVGNDARWNAEHQLQIQQYGAERTVGCQLLLSRYDRVAEALGAHGEFVERAEDLEPALERALASDRPACVNVAIEGVAAPEYRR